MNKNAVYLDNVISVALGQKKLDPHGFLEILRKRCHDLIPASHAKGSFAQDTCYFFNVAWHCFRDAKVIGPAIRGLFYDFHTYIGECAPSKSGVIHYDREGKWSRAFDEDEKRTIEGTVLSALMGVIAGPPGSADTTASAGSPEERRPTEQAAERASGQDLVAPADAVERTSGQEAVAPAGTTERTPEQEAVASAGVTRILPFPERRIVQQTRTRALFSSWSRRERAGAPARAARFGCLDLIITVPEMLERQVPEELATDD